ncbi:MAG: 2-C-methyl-D-erythritol 4-phosphate cytidylyltransferase [Nanoarchaeota archaeon]|nr:2-C-methyl-D-erythritol 4-phosphate cytidylyltransferase [Nanoarchaeota archaeon]MBU4116810.1 2-C-methyl-D-erythritol 4-phosphate cytidylyltransferase [Nanoarchaeota archaeon]
MHLRSFKRGKKRYYFIAKSVRNGKKVIQKSILYLGTADTIYKKLLKVKNSKN